MLALLGELTQMAQKISTQLDARAERLSDLIRQADERIEELRHRGGSQQSVQPEEQAVVDAPDRYDDVYALADAGHVAAEIARRLNRPKGEIELILALRTKGK